MLQVRVAEEAEMVNILADIWDKKPSMNAMMLLSKSMQMVVELKRKLNELEKSEDIEKCESTP